MKLNKYKSIPSIPSNYQVHGYTDNGSKIKLIIFIF
jgi:hypothetical protein